MMKYSTYTWDLVGALESAFPASCKTQTTLNQIKITNTKFLNLLSKITLIMDFGK